MIGIVEHYLEHGLLIWLVTGSQINHLEPCRANESRYRSDLFPDRQHSPPQALERSLSVNTSGIRNKTFAECLLSSAIVLTVQDNGLVKVSSNIFEQNLKEIKIAEEKYMKKQYKFKQFMFKYW